MQKKSAEDIFIRYRGGTCTEEEKIFIENWILNGHSDDFDLSDEEALSDLLEIKHKLQLSPRGVRSMYRWYNIAAAAAIVIACSIGFYFYQYRFADGPLETKTQTLANDITPGGNNAILTLANGAKIILNNAANGEIAKQAGISVTKTADGQLVYRVLNGSSSSEVIYNTIETPKGGQYQIVLPDGTKVWLNAASSLRFPTAFSGKERSVELTGEGYFEVREDKRMPFRVISNNQVIEVLGTHFNINSYGDEASIKTTLLEGSVRVISNSAKNIILQPGQESLLQKDNTIKVQQADVDGAVSWKNGLFHFNNTDLKTVMRQLARWYDVHVRYEGAVPDLEFGGAIERSLNLSEVFEILEKSKVHFRIEGREVVVMP